MTAHNLRKVSSHQYGPNEFLTHLECQACPKIVLVDSLYKDQIQNDVKAARQLHREEVAQNQPPTAGRTVSL